MADKKTARDTGGTFELHPADVFAARCVDLIDLGLHPEKFQDQPEVLKDKVALVFLTSHVSEDGKPGELGIEFTCTFGSKANLRKFAETWRGKPYTDEEAKTKGVPLEKFVGVPALLTVVHKTSKKGNQYAAIGGISKLPAAMATSAPEADGYSRSEFWEKKKAEYAAATLAWTGNQPKGDEPDEPAYGGDDVDDLPFSSGGKAQDARLAAMYDRLDDDENEDGMPGSPTWVLERE